MVDRPPVVDGLQLLQIDVVVRRQRRGPREVPVPRGGDEARQDRPEVRVAAAPEARRNSERKDDTNMHSQDTFGQGPACSALAKATNMGI